MLRFFRINDPYRLVAIFIVMVLVRLIFGYRLDGVTYFELKWLLLGEWLGQGHHMYSETFDYTGPLAAGVYKAIDFLFGRSALAHHGFSTLIIIVQAAILNQIFLKNKAYSENGYLPAFLYTILMVCIPDYMALSPQLMSLTFILLALRNVLRRIDNLATDELFINTGIFVGIATMIYLPAIVYFIVFLVALVSFSTAVLRRLLLYLFSFLLVFTLCAVYYFLRGDLPIFMDSFFIQGLMLNKAYSLDVWSIITCISGFLVVFVLSVLRTWSSARFTNFQQKIQQVMWLMFFGGIATFFLSNEKSLHELVFFVPIISFFWTHYFILLRRKIFRLIMPIFLIVGLLVYTDFAYTRIEGTFAISEVEAKPATMVLGTNIALYQTHKIFTPCFDTHLTNRALAGLDYYHTAGAFYSLFKKINPVYIKDELGIMPKLKERFPEIEADYRLVEPDLYQKLSN